MGGYPSVEWNIWWFTSTWAELREALLDWSNQEPLYRDSLYYDWTKAAMECLPRLRNDEMTGEQRAAVNEALQEIGLFTSQIAKLGLAVPDTAPIREPARR